MTSLLGPLIWVAITSDADALPFAFIAAGVCGYRAHRELFCVALDLSLTSGVLHWEAPLRKGDIPLDEISGVHVRPGVVVIEYGVGRTVLVTPANGLFRLLRQIEDVRPDLRLAMWE